MTSATIRQPEFFLTDERITADIQTLNYKVSAIDEMGNRKVFNILVPYFVQLNAQVEKFLLGETGTKWTVLTKEILEQPTEDTATEAQAEFESYLDNMVEEIAANPVTEAEDFMLSAGYDAKAMLACTHTRSYRMYVKGRAKEIAYARDNELLARCQQWVKSEEMRKRDRALHLQYYGIAV